VPSDTPQAPSGTQAINRAITVLKVLAEADTELSVSAIASSLGLTSGTARRIVRALLAEGLVAQNPRTDAYYLGSATILLGQAAQRGFGLDKALPIL
jgi:IclR family acetate operon transcriptional repressor